ncbi:ABC transporter substrate-binding protein [Streptomyces corynorhini]|uniref:Putative aliphatic sulfonates-binding protein n=1 Tax=Streptomyces corynorhini TaxID=2282652 RepID=A0A370ANU4_9ACTN|nr:ABC transporter substrate-binding protein [Streptomyces corynorhini]RDG31041.1 ABC transporter substrate-binding protein [Streptomyces corynorhini]
MIRRTPLVRGGAPARRSHFGVRAGAAVLALAGLVLTTAGCGTGTDAAASGAAAGGEAGAGTTLVLGDQAKNLQTLANASGAFDNAPYTVKWAEFEGAAPLFQAAQAGAVDTTYAADLPTLQALSGGVPVKAVAGLRNDGTAVGIVVRKNSKIRKVADLKGQTVVVSSAKGSISEYLLANALQQAGLSYADVKVRYLLPTDAQAAFSAGKIDTWAIFGVYKAVATQQGGREIVNGEDGRVSGYGFIGASDKALADSAKKTALTDALRRIGKALEWARSHPDQYATAISENNGASADVAKTIVSQSYGRLVPITPEVTGAVQKVADTMHSIKVLDPNVTVADSVDSGLYPK